MAVKTAQQLVDAVKEHIGNRTDKDSLILTTVNETIKRIAARPTHQFSVFEELHTVPVTTLGGRDYALQTRLKAVQTAHLILDSVQFWTLNQLAVERGERDFMTGTQFRTGRPSQFWVWGKRFYLDATPDQNYDVEFRITRIPTDLALGDSHVFGEEMEQPIEAGATALMFHSLQEHGDAVIWERRFETLLQEVIDMEKKKPNWAPSLRPLLFNQGFYQPNNPFSPGVRG